MTAAAIPVLVIGGGVAGAAVAAHLAQAGRPVLLIERRAEPHHKVCGEFISGEAALYLDDLAVDLAALGAVRMRVVRLATGRGLATAPLPFPAFSVSRRVLDEALLAAAAERGAVIRRGHGVRSLTHVSAKWAPVRRQGHAPNLPPHGGGWIATLDDGETVAAADVFLATGKHDLRGWKRPPGAQSDLIAFKLHWRLASDQMAALGAGVELTLFSGGYAGLEPVEDGLANLCLVVRRKRFAALAHVPAKWMPVRRQGHAPISESQRWEALLAELRAASPLLERRLAEGTPCWNRPLAIGAIPYGYVATGDSGPWRLGDQAAVIPSFSGDGIAIALHSARLAADIYLAGGAAGEFQQRLARDVAAQVRHATRLSRLLVHPPAQVVAGIAARLVPDLVAGIAQVTRIPSPLIRCARDIQVQVV